MFSHAFSKDHRVLNTDEYRTIMKHGLKHQTTHFTLFMNKNNKENHRLGIVASRKTGNAVIRNRAKRAIREYFRKHLKHTKKTDNYDFVFMCRKNMGSIRLHHIHDNMAGIYGKNFNIIHSHVPERVVRAVS